VSDNPYLDKKIILYAPTWREYGSRSSFFPFDDKDLSVINNFLIKEDAYLLLRGHREEMELISTNYDQNETFSRIISAHQDLFPDVQQLLSYTDVLLTDYSSIYFDYLLLDKPMIFLPYDLDEYQSYRGFLFDYDAYTPGVKVFNQKDFLKELEISLNVPEILSVERVRMRDLFHLHQNGGSSKRILMQINKMNS
jgi:CDP-glycerol glycerophosphotransferase (TagB/SpsB family)